MGGVKSEGRLHGVTLVQTEQMAAFKNDSLTTGAKVKAVMRPAHQQPLRKYKS